MSVYVTVGTIIAPVQTEVLEQFDDLTVIGDKSVADLDENGLTHQVVDLPENSMGVVALLFHDQPEPDKAKIEAYFSGFSAAPTEVRFETIQDPVAGTGDGLVSRRFQNKDGAFVVYGGFLLVAPTPEDKDSFFEWGRDLLFDA